jgi:hypothetical protein
LRKNREIKTNENINGNNNCMQNNIVILTYSPITEFRVKSRHSNSELHLRNIFETFLNNKICLARESTLESAIA